MKWTKRQIKAMCSEIAGFVLVNRCVPHERLKACVDAHRTTIVTNGLRGMHGYRADMAAKYREVASNAVYGTDEQARFARLALESEKLAQFFSATVAKVEAEGLPAEVTAYDVFARCPPRSSLAGGTPWQY